MTPSQYTTGSMLTLHFLFSLSLSCHFNGCTEPNLSAYSLSVEFQWTVKDKTLKTSEGSRIIYCLKTKVCQSDQIKDKLALNYWFYFDHDYVTGTYSSSEITEAHPTWSMMVVHKPLANQKVLSWISD